MTLQASRYQWNCEEAIKLHAQLEFLRLEHAYHLYKGELTASNRIWNAIIKLDAQLDKIWDEQVELFFKINKQAI